MNFFKRNIWTICLILTAVLISEPTMAAEGQGTLIGIAKSKALTTFQNVKSIIFIVGGFGLVALHLWPFLVSWTGKSLQCWPSVWLFWPLPVLSLTTLPVPVLVASLPIPSVKI